MYKVTLEGISRIGEFIIEGEVAQRTALRIEEPLSPSGGDIFDVYIENKETKDSVLERWVVMWGKAREIEKIMDEDLPMTLLEHKTITKILDANDEESFQMLSYAVGEVKSPVIKRADIYKKLKSNHRTLIAGMYERAEMDIEVFEATI